MERITDPTEDTPCARGCTWDAASEDEAPRPKPAKHGRLCNSDFYRLTAALKLVPDLMANMRAQLFSMGAADYSERVSGGGGEAPAPLNLGPLDASDELFARLHSWVALLAEELNVSATVVPVWRNDKRVQGSVPVSVEESTRRAAMQTRWLLDRIEPILATVHGAEFYRDMVEGWDGDSRSVFSLAAQYGINARPTPQADMRQCPDCEHWTVFLKLPNAFDADYAVLCGRCGWTAETNLYARHTGRAGVAAIVSTRGGVCVICTEKIKPGSLVNHIEGMTTHDGCEGFIEPKEQQYAEREVDHPKEVLLHRLRAGDVLASVALVTAADDVRQERPPVPLRGRPGVRDTPREGSGVTRFTAKFAAPCAGGCDGIEPGDEVEYEDDVLMHTVCENSAGLREDYPERATQTCPECFIIMPCGCGEF